ncbi:hypothetical protein [Hymenobacter sp. UYP22]|uniref:hypothetical protein n=1 Tax=Hymenobacter sp. UYP22 TaxID=3156348 RepID=UPI003395A501
MLNLTIFRAGLLSIGLTLSGCGVRSVLYGDEAHRHGAINSGNVTRVYFDQEGSLYPAAKSGVRVDNQRLDYHKGVLQYYYQYQYATQRNGSEVKPDWASNQRGELAALQTYYQAEGAKVTPAATGTDYERVKAANDLAWRNLQLAMQEQFIRQFKSHLSATKTEALVILVHGYNNDVDQAAWYSLLERRIQTEYFPDKNVHFLEVRWDGRTAKIPFRIWPYAQYSMYPVGLGLRRIMANLDPELPLYVMGHSTGAPLTCAALWNCTSALQSKSTPATVWGEEYTALVSQELYQTPKPASLRVALVAPAMPGLHFRDFANRTPSLPAGASPPNGYERFIVAHNQHDIATGKWILPASWGVGSTTLGVRKEEYCQEVVPGVRRSGSKTETYLLDFTAGMKANDVRSGHGVAQFMEDKANFKCLLDAWLADPTGVAPPCTSTCP